MSSDNDFIFLVIQLYLAILPTRFWLWQGVGLLEMLGVWVGLLRMPGVGVGSQAIRLRNPGIYHQCKGYFSVYQIIAVLLQLNIYGRSYIQYSYTISKIPSSTYYMKASSKSLSDTLYCKRAIVNASFCNLHTHKS